MCIVLRKAPGALNHILFTVFQVRHICLLVLRTRIRTNISRIYSSCRPVTGVLSERQNTWNKFRLVCRSFCKQFFNHRFVEKRCWPSAEFVQVCRNVVVEWLAFLLCIREVPGSNLGPETGYPDSVFVGFSAPLGKFTLNWTTAASFQILIISSFIYHPFIRRCIVCVTEKASLNNYRYKHIYAARKEQYACRRPYDLHC
jgi:hypothetical protein